MLYYSGFKTFYKKFDTDESKKRYEEWKSYVVYNLKCLSGSDIVKYKDYAATMQRVYAAKASSARDNTGKLITAILSIATLCGSIIEKLIGGGAIVFVAFASAAVSAGVITFLMLDGYYDIRKLYWGELSKVIDTI